MSLFSKISGTINGVFQIGLGATAVLLKLVDRAGFSDNVAFRNVTDSDFGGVELNQIVVHDATSTRKTIIQKPTGGAGDVVFNLPRTDGTDYEVLMREPGSTRSWWAIPKTEKQISLFWTFPENKTNRIIAKSAYPILLQSLLGLATSSGSLTLTVKINGTNVTGMTNLSVSSTPIDATATAANLVSTNDFVDIEISNVSGALNLQLTLKGMQR